MNTGLALFTLFHVIVSLVGIFSGFRIVSGLLAAQRLTGWNTLFLWSTALTSITGFLFPYHGFLPSHGVGLISLVVLSVAVIARTRFRLGGAWGRVYAVTAVTALYLNVFVLIVQAFRKVPFLNTLAPTQSEPPFLGAQAVVFVVYLVVTVMAAIRFHVAPDMAE